MTSPNMDLVDPVYEVDAPKFYDFANLSANSSKGDSWFDNHIEDSLVGMQEKEGQENPGLETPDEAEPFVTPGSNQVNSSVECYYTPCVGKQGLKDITNQPTVYMSQTKTVIKTHTQTISIEEIEREEEVDRVVLCPPGPSNPAVSTCIETENRVSVGPCGMVTPPSPIQQEAKSPRHSSTPLKEETVAYALPEDVSSIGPPQNNNDTVLSSAGCMDQSNSTQAQLLQQISDTIEVELTLLQQVEQTGEGPVPMGDRVEGAQQHPNQSGKILAADTKERPKPRAREPMKAIAKGPMKVERSEPARGRSATRAPPAAVRGRSGSRGPTVPKPFSFDQRTSGQGVRACSKDRGHAAVGATAQARPVPTQPAAASSKDTKLRRRSKSLTDPSTNLQDNRSKSATGAAPAQNLVERPHSSQSLHSNTGSLHGSQSIVSASGTNGVTSKGNTQKYTTPIAPKFHTEERLRDRRARSVDRRNSTVPKEAEAPKRRSRALPDPCALPAHPPRPATKPVPFGFLQRDGDQAAKMDKWRQQQIKMQNDEIMKCRFRASPAPNFDALKPPRIRPVSASATTKPVAPKFRTDKIVAVHKEREQKAVEDQLAREKADREFHARPAAVLDRKPFTPEKKERTKIRTMPVRLATESRTTKWNEFLEQQKQRKGAEEQARHQAEAEKRQREEAEVLRLRQRAIFKAQPVKTYPPVEPRRSSKSLTDPETPNFGRAKKGNSSNQH